MKNTRRVGLYVALVCSCDAQLELDVPEDGEAAAWVTVHRFANAHEKCGYVTPIFELGQTSSSSGVTLPAS